MSSFCHRPFSFFTIASFSRPRGDVYVCCHAWLDRPIGNLLLQSAGEIWNGESAREIRASVLDGSYRYCNRSVCPYLQSGDQSSEVAGLLSAEEVAAVVRDDLVRLPWGPQAVNCAFDNSCNLSCPTCRKEPIVEVSGSAEILEIQGRVSRDVLPEARQLSISGSGDPFGSPFSREWLRSLRREQVPRMQRIHLHTNALLWTEPMWLSIREDVRELIVGADISIDAATPATYAVNRRGGDWGRLNANLGFIAELRRRGSLRHVKVCMVPQDNNFREMPAFVGLGRRFGFDEVYFSQLVNWGTFTDTEFGQRAVHLPGHPRHPELLELLRDPIFAEEGVSLGNLAHLRRFADKEA